MAPTSPVIAAPVVTITSPIAGDNIVNASEAAAGFTISGTASDSSVEVNGQTVTVNIVNGSDTVVDTYTPTVSNHAWSVNVSSTDAQALADGAYTVTANITDVAINPATEVTQALTLDTNATETVSLAAAPVSTRRRPRPRRSRLPVWMTP